MGNCVGAAGHENALVKEDVPTSVRDGWRLLALCCLLSLASCLLSPVSMKVDG